MKSDLPARHGLDRLYGITHLLCESEVVSHADIATGLSHVDVPDVMAAGAGLCKNVSLERKIEQYESRLIRRAIDRTQGNIAEASKLLQIKRTTLRYRAKLLGILPIGGRPMSHAANHRATDF